MATELNENKFIAEQYTKNPSPFWIWLGVIAAFGLLVWAGQNWYYQWIETRLVQNPFLQVTNREMSLFLWQNPEHMRVNARQKTGYLSAFQYVDKHTVEPLLAEDYVEAPPELLFLYHTWYRLLYKEFTVQPVSTLQFKEFISYAAEWQPLFWSKAPKEYSEFVKELLKDPLATISKTGDTIPLSLLPFEVQRAFQGWKNFFIDKEAVNEIQPSIGQMALFLKQYPYYARNYWRNILAESVPNYLKSVDEDAAVSEKDSDKVIPKEELAPFLKVAFYNFQPPSVPE